MLYSNHARNIYKRCHEVGAEPQFRAIVISVHGVNTTGPWQKNVLPLLTRKALYVVGADYGFNVLKLARPKALLKKAVESVWELFNKHHQEQLPFCAIGHSFGTLALAELLDTHQDARFDRIILAGSIVDRNFPWANYVADRRLGGILNEASKDDSIVNVCGLLKVLAPSLRVGRSGRKGFLDPPPELTQRFHKCGHSGVLSEFTCDRSWAPFLLSENQSIQW